MNPFSHTSSQTDTSKWETLTIPEIFEEYGSDPDSGLCQVQVEQNRDRYGFNEVVEKKKSPLLGFLRKFWGLSAWMLELILLSAILGKYPDVVVVSVLLVVNAAISFIQDQRASGVVEALRSRLMVNARVLRDARWQVIPARELLPGDIIRVRSGDIAPADCKTLSGEVSVDQSTLTGESMDVDIKMGEFLPSGSVVRRGEGTGIVVSTGSNTFYGRTIELVQQARPKLHIEAVVSKMVQWMAIIVSLLILTVMLISFNRGTALVEILPLMLVLMMSAVPVALPVMFTVSMAIGAAELSKRGVLVTRLSAAEDAALMDVLCVDKTGTITMNQLAVASILPLNGFSENAVLASGALASEIANQDPIDLAFLKAAEKNGSVDTHEKSFLISFLPFNARTRRTEAVVEQGGQRIHVMKGALRTIAKACGLTNSEIMEIEKNNLGAAQKGFRTLAVAQATESSSFKLIGLVNLHDPLRPDASPLISELKKLGIAVKMLTGDALSVAQEIGKGVGITHTRRVADIKSPVADSEKKTENLLEGADGLAEVYPEDKFTVVKQLQAAGHIVGMTGDGVNDAPALRQAEVGIAVNCATDVAKGAASVVLTNSGLIDILALVTQGRAIYQRILTWIINKISRTILKAAYVAFAYLITGKFVVSAYAMLLMVLLNDSAKISLATDNVRPSQNPETWKIGGFIGTAAVLGVAMVIESLALLGLSWQRFGLAANEGALHTFSFLVMLYMAVFSIVSIRERRRFWTSKPSKALTLSLVMDAVLGTTFAYAGLPGLTPLPWWQLMIIFFYAMVMSLAVNDTIKIILFNQLVPKKSE